jgi:hypothetical protein
VTDIVAASDGGESPTHTTPAALELALQAFRALHAATHTHASDESSPQQTPNQADQENAKTRCTDSEDE